MSESDSVTSSVAMLDIYLENELKSSSKIHKKIASSSPTSAANLTPTPTPIPPKNQGSGDRNHLHSLVDETLRIGSAMKKQSENSLTLLNRTTKRKEGRRGTLCDYLRDAGGSGSDSSIDSDSDSDSDSDIAGHSNNDEAVPLPRQKSVNTLANNGKKTISKSLINIDTSQYAAVVRDTLIPADRKISAMRDDPDAILRRLKDSHHLRVKRLERSRQTWGFGEENEDEDEDNSGSDIESESDVEVENYCSGNDSFRENSESSSIGEVEKDSDFSVNSSGPLAPSQKKHLALAQINASIQDGINGGLVGRTRARRMFELVDEEDVEGGGISDSDSEESEGTDDSTSTASSTSTSTAVSEKPGESDDGETRDSESGNGEGRQNEGEEERQREGKEEEGESDENEGGDKIGGTQPTTSLSQTPIRAQPPTPPPPASSQQQESGLTACTTQLFQVTNNLTSLMSSFVVLAEQSKRSKSVTIAPSGAELRPRSPSSKNHLPPYPPKSPGRFDDSETSFASSLPLPPSESSSPIPANELAAAAFQSDVSRIEKTDVSTVTARVSKQNCSSQTLVTGGVKEEAKAADAVAVIGVQTTAEALVDTAVQVEIERKDIGVGDGRCVMSISTAAAAAAPTPTPILPSCQATVPSKKKQSQITKARAENLSNFIYCLSENFKARSLSIKSAFDTWRLFSSYPLPLLSTLHIPSAADGTTRTLEKISESCVFALRDRVNMNSSNRSFSSSSSVDGTKLEIEDDSPLKGRGREKNAASPSSIGSRTKSPKPVFADDIIPNNYSSSVVMTVENDHTENPLEKCGLFMPARESEPIQERNTTPSTAPKPQKEPSSYPNRNRRLVPKEDEEKLEKLFERYSPMRDREAHEYEFSVHEEIDADENDFKNVTNRVLTPLSTQITDHNVSTIFASISPRILTEARQTLLANTAAMSAEKKMNEKIWDGAKESIKFLSTPIKKEPKKESEKVDEKSNFNEKKIAGKADTNVGPEKLIVNRVQSKLASASVRSPYRSPLRNLNNNPERFDSPQTLLVSLRSKVNEVSESLRETKRAQDVRRAKAVQMERLNLKQGGERRPPRLFVDDDADKGESEKKVITSSGGMYVKLGKPPLFVPPKPPTKVIENDEANSIISAITTDE